MNARNEPRVVAELGRPETPDETAARKAETSRKHRANQTFLNLILALVASLAVVLVTILVVVRPDLPAAPPIDYQSIATEAGSSVPLAAPVLPAGWAANSAVYNGSPADGVATWYIGFITPKQQFIGLRQGIDANPTWLANQLGSRLATDSTTVGGVEWQVYDYRSTKDVGNYAHALSTSDRSSSFVVYGTATDEEFDTLVTALAKTMRQ